MGLGILTVVFLGIITVFMTGHSDISQSGRDTGAAVITQSLAENMRNLRPADLDLLDGITTENPAGCPGALGSRINTVCTEWIAQVAQLPEGRGTLAVTQIPNPTTGILMRRITITVGWSEVGRGGRQVVLTAGRSD